MNFILNIAKSEDNLIEIFFQLFIHRPKVDDKKKKGGYNSTREIKPPPKKSRIDSNIVKLKLLDATRKAIMDKSLKPPGSKNSQGTQTDTFKTKLCKDVEVDNQADLVNPVDQSTETEMDYVAVKGVDGKREQFACNVLSIID